MPWLFQNKKPYHGMCSCSTARCPCRTLPNALSFFGTGGVPPVARFGLTLHEDLALDVYGLSPPLPSADDHGGSGKDEAQEENDGDGHRFPCSGLRSGLRQGRLKVQRLFSKVKRRLLCRTARASFIVLHFICIYSLGHCLCL